MKATGKIRVMSVDDHPIVRDGIAAIINLQPDMTLVGAAETGTQALQKFVELRPDIALVDLRLPDMTGFELIKKLKDKSPNARIIVLSSHEGDVDIQRALEAGAKSPPLIVAQPEQVASHLLCSFHCRQSATDSNLNILIGVRT